MKKLCVVSGFLLTFTMLAMAGEWSGYVSDTACTKTKSTSTLASAAHADCAKTCIKGGSPAVLVTNDGKIYKIADQDKIIDYAGQKVTIEGDLKGETITVTKVKQ